jgi:dipeptidyl-peptidase 4
MKNFLKNCYNMNRKYFLASVLWCTGMLTAIAQTAGTRQFTMQEATNGLGSSLAPLNLRQLQWYSASEFLYTVTSDGTDKIVKYTLPSARIDTLLALADINNAMSLMKYDSVKRMPTITWQGTQQGYFAIGGRYYLLKAGGTGAVVSLLYELPADAENIAIHAKTMQVAYTSKYNLYACAPSATPRQITTDGSANLLYGTSVHRDEFGIDHGIFWHDNGKWLAFYQMDQSMVTDYPIINWTDVPASVTKIKYPFAGAPSHHVSLFTFDVKNNIAQRVRTADSSEQYLTSVSWHPTDPKIYIGILSRQQTSLQLVKFDGASGKYERSILSETHEKYVEPQHELFFVPNKPNYFVWWSQKDGYMHLYLTDELTGKQKQITNGKWIVNDIVGYNNSTEELIITGTYDGPLEKNIYAADIFDRTVRKLNRVGGMHNALVCADGSYILDNYSNKATPRAIDVLGVNGDFEKRVLTAKNPLIDYATAQVENITLYASDSTKLYGKLMLPANFDNTKKYPVIVYLYNGPHVQLINNRFPESGNLWYDYLTQRGYIVFSMDGRGSSNRGFKFESATHRQLGTVEMDDQMKGVNFLHTLPYVDTARMGIHGWSFGGFMTTSFMLRQPGVFKVGVAGGPVMDWSKYEIMYTERYMGTPQNNPEGYAQSLLLDKSKNLQGKLLIIHGTDDNVVTWQHSNAFLSSTVDNNVQCDYFTYPGHEHNVRGKDRVHLMQKITNYFDQYLKP